MLDTLKKSSIQEFAEDIKLLLEENKRLIATNEFYKIQLIVILLQESNKGVIKNLSEPETYQEVDFSQMTLAISFDKCSLRNGQGYIIKSWEDVPKKLK
jgi:hypothetical protein